MKGNGALSQYSNAEKTSEHSDERDMGGKPYSDDPALRDYLQFVISANQNLYQNMSSIRVPVPLDDLFVSFSKQLPFTLSAKHQKELEELRRRPDLGDEEREERVQRMRAIWYSQLQQEQALLEPVNKQHITIQEILQPLQTKSPAAVILGAPGSGKSTAVRWLALQMARALLWPETPSTHKLSPVQIPILINLREYAACFSTEHLSFGQFLTRRLVVVHSDLPAKLLAALEQGHCLLLFDGFDEVGSDSLRRQIVETIRTFVSYYSVDKSSNQFYNRFIITSRIVGYEPEDFLDYTPYTILELIDEQVEHLLTKWSLAIERHSMKLTQAMKPLTAEQDEQCTKSSLQQRDQLLTTLNNNLDLKHLGRNPLMLTMLASMQRSGMPFPRDRIKQYREVSHLLLETWRRGMEGKIVPGEIISFAEELLSNLAYQLQTNVSYLTEQQVRKAISETMVEFREHILETTESAAQQLITVIQATHGPFVEIGQGLFGFPHLTLQEYFVARYLLRKSFDKLVRFMMQHLHSDAWREPLLCAVAFKSQQSSSSGRREASELIRAAADTSDDYEAVLHRHMLFAADAIVACNASGIDGDLQSRIIGDLFELYGRSYSAAHHSKLRERIEKVVLLWLQRLPRENNQQRTWPPLLETWRKVLCDDSYPVRQEGAIHLLAMIAPNLSDCSKTVLLALIPPLLQLANVLDFPFPVEVRDCLYMPKAHPASLKVEEYACVALRLLDKLGPAGWLHGAWLKWSAEQPVLLERLARHSLELEYLITPSALPVTRIGPNWIAQYNIGCQWDMTMQRITSGELPSRLLHDACQLQTRLLQASDAARYPIAFFIKQLLTEEKVEA